MAYQFENKNTTWAHNTMIIEILQRNKKKWSITLILFR